MSGGNYFRKNADGSIGDDVSDIYGSDVTEQDYADVREKYRMFNSMMQNGIQFYIMQPDVNRLVAFLRNPDNDELLKQAVLNRLINDQERSQEPNDFQGALARARSDLRNNDIRYRESVLVKFDKLSLIEKLQLLDKVDANKINETWKKVSERPLTKDEEKDKEKYVKGMKKNAKDFKKRYGKDAKAVMYATATKMAKESLADLEYYKRYHKKRKETITPQELEKRTFDKFVSCLLYTSPSPRDQRGSRMPSSA